MYLEEVKLSEFRNYSSLHFSPGKGMNVIAGENGSGKTNLLDAIHYLALGKSGFGLLDQHCFKEGSDFFRLEGDFNKKAQSLKVVVKSKKGSGRELEKDGLKIERLADHVGTVPVILSGPMDVQLVHGSSEMRRSLMDSSISQYDMDYLTDLISYQRILKQKTAELKRLRSMGSHDLDMIQTYHEQMIPLNEKIYEKRKMFIKEAEPICQRYYKEVSGGRESVSIEFKSQLNERSPKEYGTEGLNSDLQSQRNLFGIHRDDLEILLDGANAKKYGSQGQQKSVIAALRLMQWEVLKNACKEVPLLLLDDIFDRLDKERSKNLVELLLKNDELQSFVSDAIGKNRVDVFPKDEKRLCFFTIERGKLKENGSK